MINIPKKCQRMDWTQAASLAILDVVREIYADPLLEKVFDNLPDNTLPHGYQVTEIRVSGVRVKTASC
jgi:hypothetical protein